MLKLYGCPNTRSMRVAWALEEAGAEYDYEPVILLKGEGAVPPARATRRVRCRSSWTAISS